MRELKIPKERVGCLVGVRGVVKRDIEKVMHVKLTISREGDIEINGNSVDEFNTETIVKAVGRGFNPKVAMLLANENIFLEVISIFDFVKKNKKKFVRIKARLIGTKGKARTYIEKLTDTYICVFGKTVSIIGEMENVQVARQGIEKLLNGAPHSNVYRHITEELKKRGM